MSFINKDKPIREVLGWGVGVLGGGIVGTLAKKFFVNEQTGALKKFGVAALTSIGVGVFSAGLGAVPTFLAFYLTPAQKAESQAARQAAVDARY